MLANILDIFFTYLSVTTLSIGINKAMTRKMKFIPSVFLLSTVFVLIFAIAEFSSLYKRILPDFDIQQNVKSFTITAFLFFYIFVAFRDKALQKFKTFAVTLVCLVGYEALFTALTVTTFEISAYEVHSLSASKRILIGLNEWLMYLLMAYSVYFFSKKRAIKVSVPVFLNFLAIILMNSVMVAVVFTSNAYNKDTFTKAVLLIASVFMLFLCYTLYRLLIKVSDREALKEKLYWMENVKSLELEYYNNLQQKTNEVRKIRHDFKDNIDTVKLLVDENTEESIRLAKEILSSLDNSIKAAKIPVYTDNLVVNTVVGAKADEANKAGITFNGAIDIPHELSFESIDLNCVFLNLLNNAIESCKKLPDGENKEITLKAAVKAGYLIIKTENPYISLDTDISGKIKTSKTDKENHGFGMTLINDIAQKYDGTFETKTENGIFTAVLSLKI